MARKTTSKRVAADWTGRHEQLAREIGRMVDAKDAAYGQAVAIVPALLRLLYPEGIRPEQYLEAALLVRIQDKVVRIARGDARAFTESPWRDIVGYSLRAVEMEGERPAPWRPPAPDRRALDQRTCAGRSSMAAIKAGHDAGLKRNG